ncbi:SH3 domain-containing protein [Persephonella sp.]
MKRNLSLSLLIIILIIIDIILIQEFFSQKISRSETKEIPIQQATTQPEKTNFTFEEKKEQIKNEVKESDPAENNTQVSEKLSAEKTESIKEKKSEISEKKIENQTKTLSKSVTTEESFIPATAKVKVFLNLREQPRLDSKVITVIRKGAKVKIIDKKFNHWKKVIYVENNKEYTGWVDDRYLEILENN